MPHAELLALVFLSAISTITAHHAHAQAAAPRRTAHRGYCHTGGPAHLRSLVVRLQMPQQERLGAGWRSFDAVHCGCVQRLLRARAGSIASLQRAAEDRTPTVQLGGSRRGRARRADRHLLAAPRQPDHPAVRRGRRSVQRVRRVHVGRAALVRPGQDEPRGRTAAAQRAGGPLRARLLRAGAARPPARPAVASQRAVLTRGGGGGVRRDGRGGHRRRLPRLRAAARGGRLRRDAAGQGDDGVALDDPQDLPRERAAQARPAPHGPSHFGRAPRRVVADAPTHHNTRSGSPARLPSHTPILLTLRPSQPQGARGGAREAVPRRRAHAARPDVRRRGAARSTRLRAPRAAAGAAAADPALWRRYLLQRWPRRQSQRRRRRRWRQAWRWRRTRRWWWWWRRRRRVGPRGAAADSDPTRQRLAVGHVRAAADVPRGARRRRGALQHRRYGAAAMAPARWLRRDGVEDGHAHRPLRAVAARRAGAPRSTVAILRPVAIRSVVAILQPRGCSL